MRVEIKAMIQKIDFRHIGLILLVLAVALSARIYVSFFTGLPWFNTDSYTYLQMADAILSAHPIASFPNGFPLLIVILKSICRPEAVPFAVIALNVVLSVLVVVMTADIARKISGSGMVACAAGLVIALYPNQLNYVRQILTEVPTTFVLTLSVFLLLRRRYFMSGLALYLAVLFRSSLLPILPILLVCGLLHPNARIAKRSGGSWLAGLGVVLALYSILLIAGVVKPSKNLGSNLLVSINADSQNVDFSLRGFTAGETQHPLHTYIDFATHHPAEFLKQRVLSLQELWGWPTLGGDYHRSFAARVSIAVRFPFLILAIIGFVRHIRKFDVWLLFIPIVALTIVHAAMFSTPRFTYVVEPFLVVLAVIALRKSPLRDPEFSRNEGVGLAVPVAV